MASAKILKKPGQGCQTGLAHGGAKMKAMYTVVAIATVIGLMMQDVLFVKTGVKA